MYPTDLYMIDWEVIDTRDIIGNINNMGFHSGPLPPSFRTFNTTYTKTPKGPSNNDHIEQPSGGKAIKIKGLKFKINHHLVNKSSETLKS